MSDTSAVDDDIARALARYVDYRIDSLRIPQIFRGLPLESDQLRAWVAEAVATSMPGGIYMHGPTGTHKTGNAFAALVEAARLGFGYPDTWSSRGMIDWEKIPHLMRGLSLDAQRDRIEVLSQAGLVLLDDLGAGVDSVWVDEQLCRLVDVRYDECLPTIITSNLPLDSVAECFGDRIASRLGTYRELVFTGPDARGAA